MSISETRKSKEIRFLCLMILVIFLLSHSATFIAWPLLLPAGLLVLCLARILYLTR
jgi:hypothetical protein